MTDENINDTNEANDSSEGGEESTELKASEEPSTSAPPESDGGDLKPDEKTMGMLAHLLGIISCFIGPLVIWLIKKDESEFVDDQGKEALNWQITLTLVWIICTIVFFIPFVGLVTCIIYPLVGIVAIVLAIIAGLAANKGERYRYPVALRLIK